MKLLLDTHVAVWAISDTQLLPTTIKELIADPHNEIRVSAISVLEIAIKRAAGKLTAPAVSSREAVNYFLASGYKILACTAEHSIAVEALPLLHRDPFDRLLVAQALTEPLRLVTHDKQVAAYDSNIILF